MKNRIICSITGFIIIGLLAVFLCSCAGRSDKKESQNNSSEENGETNGTEGKQETDGTAGTVGAAKTDGKTEDKSSEGEEASEPSESSFEKAKKASSPDLSQIRSICELATLECYYHNVAKSIKEKGKGLSHIGEKERVFWIEYSGVARFGINVSKVMMKVDGTKITITIPKAELLGLSDHTFTEGSYISSDDGINKNPITSENQTQAVAAAEEDIREMFAQDDAILSKAQDNAKKLIENYIRQLGQISEVDYEITWNYEDNIPEAAVK